MVVVEDDDEVSVAEDVLLEDEEFVDVVVVCVETGSFPSFLAVINASTNSDFSKNVRVEIP